MTYNDKAFNIVKHSINSAVFIDEKAKEFYSEIPIDNDVIEEQLSVELFNQFKSEGVSLAVHKFNVADISNEELKQYLLKDRDLVLLDWELDATGGIDYSLKLLSEVVGYPHINFCCIYTSTSKFDDITLHINTFFSGFSKADYENVLSAYSFLDINDFLEPAKTLLASNNDSDIDSFLKSIGVDLADFPIEYKSNFDALKILIDSFGGFEKSEKREMEITSTSKESNSFIINNTFVFILKKDVVNDTKPSALIKRISEELTKNKNSFIQLLGLEMQTIFNNNGSFINESMLQSSTEAFFTHRNYLKEKNKNDIPFNTLIKKVLIEHATLRLRTAKLSLLDADFLDEESKNYNQIPSDEEVASMNTFYNSVIVTSLNNIDLPNVNFGDIFINSEGVYYLCVTALCDCLRPGKIKHNYFFVEGKEIPIDTANLLGDSAFVSYIPNNKAVSWINYESTKVKKANNAGLDPKDAEINNLKSKINALEQFKYKPVYIQPHIFNIRNPKIENNTIELRRVESVKKIEEGKDSGDLNIFNASYVTTLRPNYTQRIANHTFAHSVRVGVDFVSKR
jgi:hypothetical protein